MFTINSSGSLKLNFGLSWSGVLKDVFIQVQWHCKVWFCCNGEIWTFKSGTYKSKWDIYRTEYSSRRKTCWPRRVKLVTIWCHFKWIIYCWLQALVHRITNKNLRLICSCLRRVMVGIGEQVYSVLLLSFFFLEVKYIIVLFVFPCVCPSIIFWWSFHWVSKFTQL